MGEFGNRYIEDYFNYMYEDYEDISDLEDSDLEKVCTHIPGWSQGLQKYKKKASIEDLREIKDSLQELLKEGEFCCRYPVHEAAQSGHLKLMEFIFCTSYDMNSRNGNGMTAIHSACGDGGTEVLRLMIESSKEFEIDLNARDRNEQTVFHFACGFGGPEVVRLMIESSKEFEIDLNPRDGNGNTALQSACGYGGLEVVTLMIESSTEFNFDFFARNQFGGTAFHSLCRRGQAESVKLLLSKLAQIDIGIKAQDNQGRTALDLVNKDIEDPFNHMNLHFDGLKKVRAILEAEYEKVDALEV